MTKYGSGTLILGGADDNGQTYLNVAEGTVQLNKTSSELAERACGDHDHGDRFRRHRAADGSGDFQVFQARFDNDYRRYL